MFLCKHMTHGSKLKRTETCKSLWLVKKRYSFVKYIQSYGLGTILHLPNTYCTQQWINGNRDVASIMSAYFVMSFRAIAYIMKFIRRVNCVLKKIIAIHQRNILKKIYNACLFFFTHPSWYFYRHVRVAPAYLIV